VQRICKYTFFSFFDLDFSAAPQQYLNRLWHAVEEALPRKPLFYGFLFIHQFEKEAYVAKDLTVAYFNSLLRTLSKSEV